MGYVSVVDGAVTRWAAEPGLLIYAILVIPLISLIMLVYVVVECRNRKERSKTAGRAGIV
jgi:cytochrome c oxidase subunit IV